ncbi:TetR/AcrR family transcriptional regulator [Actinophytocola sp.]|uniref:TetR/AcrR family transcriptional regulator n=1 Tax=Actinophytocola sp. TaxID=1872138 RepID=UPI002ED1FD59
MAAINDGLPPGFALAWGLTPTSASKRGPKPAHSVDQIVETAIRLADVEDSAALSMSRIAKELGLTANALYRYVSSKDELLVLVADTAWGPPPDSVAEATSWRDAAAVWTRAVIGRYRERPWLLDIPVHGAPVTPNLLRWLEVLLAAMAGSGPADQELLGCAMLLDGYARSTASLFRDLSGSSGPPVQSASVTGSLQPLLREHGYPVLAGMLAGGSYQDGPSTIDDDIGFGLDRLLDGIEALVTARQATATVS